MQVTSSARRGSSPRSSATASESGVAVLPGPIRSSGTAAVVAAGAAAAAAGAGVVPGVGRSEEHTSELQSLMRISYAVFCLKKKKKNKVETHSKRVIAHII